MRYFIEISYNGKNFHGWQIQDNAETIQSRLEDSLSKILHKKMIKAEKIALKNVGR